MALVGAANRRDPRFQEALLRAGAGGPKNMIGASKAITSQHVGREMQTRLDLARLAQNQREFTNRLGLARNRMRFRHKMFKQGMKDARQDLNRTTMLGLATTGFGFLEGRRRKQLTEKDNEKRDKWMADYLDILRSGKGHGSLPLMGPFGALSRSKK